MHTPPYIHVHTQPRHRGSVYILVLGASLLVAAIGVSAILAARVRYRGASDNADMIHARELARTGIDRGLWEVKNNATLWRTVFAANTMRNIPLGGGTFTVGAVDPADGDLINNTTDPAILYGIGKAGTCRCILYVTLDSDGAIVPGTWRRYVK